MALQLYVLSICLGSFAFFAIKGILSGKQSSARIQKQGGSPFLGELPMEFAYWVLTPIGNLAAKLNVSPNFLSWTCFALGLISGILAGSGIIAIAGGLSLISSVFDSLDGMVARRKGIASDAGEVLDAAVDRYTEFFFLAGVCIYYRFDVVAMLITLLALLGSYLVSYSQAKAEALKKEIPKGWMRRPERAIYLGASAFLSPLFNSFSNNDAMHYLLLAAMLLVGFFANATAIKRFLVLYRALK